MVKIDRGIDPVLEITSPQSGSGPVVFAAPHSGRCYPEAWLRSCKLSVDRLRSVEDAFVDRLFAGAPSHGSALLCARFPRSYVDVNRARTDLSLGQRRDGHGPESARARVGLGVIPHSIGANTPIYNIQPAEMEIEHRLEHYYDVYHRALDRLMGDTLRAHGQTLLIDCHSMPDSGAMNGRRADIVLGDCFGTSCAPHIIGHAAQILREIGYSVAINHPYAGGYITQRHGRPHEDCHALQIEINRALYMNAVTLRATRGFGILSQNLERFIAAMTSDFRHVIHPIAAE